MATAPRPQQDLGYHSCWRHGFTVQLHVILASMVEDTLSRCSRDNPGFFWTATNPLFLTAVIMTFWSIFHGPQGDDLAIILLVSATYFLIDMPRRVASRCPEPTALDTLVDYHQHVKSIDSLVTMAFVEAAACLTAFWISYAMFWPCDFRPGFADPLNLIGACLLTGVFSFGLDLITAAFPRLGVVPHHGVSAPMHMNTRPTIIVPPSARLPEGPQKAPTRSPLASGREVIRSVLFLPDAVTHRIATYLAVRAVPAMFFGHDTLVMGQGKMET